MCPWRWRWSKLWRNKTKDVDSRLILYQFGRHTHTPKYVCFLKYPKLDQCSIFSWSPRSLLYTTQKLVDYIVKSISIQLIWTPQNWGERYTTTIYFLLWREFFFSWGTLFVWYRSAHVKAKIRLEEEVLVFYCCKMWHCDSQQQNEEGNGRAGQVHSTADMGERNKTSLNRKGMPAGKYCPYRKCNTARMEGTRFLYQLLRLRMCMSPGLLCIGHWLILWTALLLFLKARLELSIAAVPSH